MASSVQCVIEAVVRVGLGIKRKVPPKVVAKEDQLAMEWLKTTRCCYSFCVAATSSR